jgi:hypothetical protein
MTPRCPTCGASQEHWTQKPVGDLDPLIPLNATETQRAAAKKVRRQLPARARKALEWYGQRGRAGGISEELADYFGVPSTSTNPLCTLLHQQGYLVRTARVRPNHAGNDCLVYILPVWWEPSDGERPSEKHRGIGQERDPLRGRRP